MNYAVEPTNTLIISILVLYLGTRITQKVGLLNRYNIPPAVTGGLICSLLIALIARFWQIEISFDTQIRDLLLLVFFSTIGLGAKFRLLAEGGKALALLLAVAVVFLVLQNTTGVLLALALDANPGYGLFAGSISFAGGHGTAIAWGSEAEKAGLVAAREIGIAFATFGLIAGGIIGGPIAERLITRNKLHPKATTSATAAVAADTADGADPLLRTDDVLRTILMLAICVGTGDQINRLLFAQGVLLPGFLTAMLVGIVLTNLADLLARPLNEPAIDLFNNVSLHIFLAISLMSMNLLVLSQAFGPMLLVLFAQVSVITLVAVFIVFRVMGRDYDAAVMSAGFAGLGLGATPVAIGNMQAVTGKYGASPKAFLVVPLVGAFFIDLANALVIKFFIASPLLQ